MVKSIGFGGCDTTDIVMCVLYQLSAEGIRTLVIDETEMVSLLLRCRMKDWTDAMLCHVLLQQMS